MLFPVWQPLYTSTHQLAQTISQLIHLPTTHTGTLDPLAEGVVVILTGDDRFAKGQLSDWQKEYHFSIPWGLETDSLDRLGLITDYTLSQPHQQHVVSAVQHFPSHYQQTIPAFSARRWQGHSSFEYAQQKQPIPTGTKLVQLSNFATLGFTYLTTAQILAQHHSTIAQVKGDFRQPQIIVNWQGKLNHLTRNWLLSHHVVITTPGTYVRQVVGDISLQVGQPATTWSITRTGNGPYVQSECVELDEVLALQI